MKKVILHMLCGISVAWLGGQMAWGQTLLQLDSVTVTASRLESTIPQSGKSVTVLNAVQIADLPVNSIDELLRFVTGLNVNARNGFGVQTDFGMRGSTFSQVLVLVDNIRLNDPLTAHFNNNIPVSIAEIEQVEIIRGPASTSYGPDAVGGVIHIKTKTYSSQRAAAPEITTRGQVGVGQHNLLLSDLGLVVSGRKVQFSAGMKANIADGEQLPNPNFALVNGTDSLFRNYFDLRTYTASVAYFINDAWKLYARVGYDRRDFSAKYFYTRSPFDESVEQTDSYSSQVSLRRSKGKHTTELNMGYKQSSDVFTFNPAFPANEHTMFSTIINIDHQVAVSTKGQLAVGSQFWQRAIESTDRGNHDDLSLGIYAVYAHFLAPNLRSVASARLDYDENYKLQFLPQLSLSYFKDAYTLRASAGRTVRAADFTERFVSFNLPNLTPGRNVGNPDLLAETSYSFEVGADYMPYPRTQFNSTVFYRTSRNLIDYALTNSNQIDNLPNLQPNENYFYALNVASASTWGIELQGQHRAALGTEHQHLLLSGGYAYLSTMQSGDEPSRYIANHPTHNVNAQVGYYGKYLNVVALGNYIDRDPELAERIGAEVRSNYFVANLTVEAKPFYERVSLFCTIQNLFNTQYEEILGARMPGRWVMGGVKWSVAQKRGY